MTKEDYMNHIKEDELRNREPDIYDIEDAYEEGYREAKEEATIFLEMLALGFTITDNITHTNYDKEQLVEDFKKYLNNKL